MGRAYNGPTGAGPGERLAVVRAQAVVNGQARVRSLIHGPPAVASTYPETRTWYTLPPASGAVAASIAALAGSRLSTAERGSLDAARRAATAVRTATGVWLAPREKW
jgi:hypothetical protein